MNEKSEKYVKTGEAFVSKAPEILISLGVGSCVIVCLYEENKKIGGMIHAMLPSILGRENPDKSEYLFVDKGLQKLINEIEDIGCKKEDLTAKIIGGAEMFKKLSINSINLGNLNVNSAKMLLEKESIKIISEDTGGNSGRSVKFYLENGQIEIIKRI